MNNHIIKQFDEELNKLRARLIKMGLMIQEQIDNSMKALIHNNQKLALTIISNDDKVDEIDLKIEKQCLKIFALHQPVAMDLRFVISAITINEKMEMISDLATNIAKNVLSINLGLPYQNQTNFNIIAEKLVALVTKAVDSFTFQDTSLSYEVFNDFLELKKLIKENYNIIIDLMKKNPMYIDSFTRLIIINRNLHFAANFAVGICEEVVFMVDAKIVKHRLFDFISPDNNQK
ncbi:MAG: phosphate signaling complex protein PhoU [Candidatus Kapabacteria bacterium]|nr:phosphate signaling complex protein PhoU [Candidatus Kapabacteria bacterium]